MKGILVLVLVVSISAWGDREVRYSGRQDIPSMNIKLARCRENECSNIVRKYNLHQHQLCLWKCASINCYEKAINGIDLEKVFQDTQESKKLMQVITKYWNRCITEENQEEISSYKAQLRNDRISSKLDL